MTCRAVLARRLAGLSSGALARLYSVASAPIPSWRYGHAAFGGSDPAARRDALASRLMEATLGLMDVAAIYIGDRLGLYRALAPAGW